MKRAFSLLAVPVLFVACGGRVEPITDSVDDDASTLDDSSVTTDGFPTFDSGGRVDTSVIGPDGTTIDTGVVGIDSGVIGTDGGRPDTGVIGVDTGIKDTGIVGIDTGIKDTGVVGTDTGVVGIDTGIKDTGVIGSDGGTVGPSVADCEKIAKASCTSATKSCCEGHGYIYDQIGCEDVNSNWCDDGRDGVSAGKTTYDPSFLTACAAALTKLSTTCSVPLLDYVSIYSPCSQMLNGKVAGGGICVRATECYAPPGFSAFCDDSGTTKRCRAYAIVGPGAACNYYGGVIRYCQGGYFCDYGGGPVVCKPATPIGGACFGVDDTSCGIGNTCKAGRCAVGTPYGGSCVRDLECASWSCTGSKCTNPNAEVASALYCSGT